MSLTLQQRNTCRDLLAEIKFRLVRQEDEVVSTNNRTITRYIEGIAEPVQDQCQQFLETYVSADNEEVVEIDGTTSPYDVSGEYFGTGDVLNEEPVRKLFGDGIYLEVWEDSGNYRWVLRNEWNDALFESQEQAGSVVEIDDATWTALEVSFEFTADRGTMIVPESAVVNGDVATFQNTGSITSALVEPSVGIYALVTDPKADIQTRDGTWRGGRVWTEKQQNGTFTIFQALYVLNEDAEYILSGKTITAYHTEERRLYERIPEGNVNSLINTLSALTGYTVVDTDVRLTNDRGIYNVSLRLREYTGPEESASAPKLIGVTGGLFKTNVYIIRHVADDDLSALINELNSLDLIQSARASESEEGYWNVIYSQLVLPDSRTEYEVGAERREKGSGESGWVYFNDYFTPNAKLVNGEYIEQDQVEWLNRKPDQYWTDNDTREVSVTTQFSYSSTEPSNPSYSGGETSVGGRKRMLSNGIWEKTIVTIYKPWWDR